MKNNQQTPSTPSNNIRTSLIAVVAAILVGTGLYVWQVSSSTNETIDDTRKVQQSDANASKADAYKGWKSYTWTDGGVTFKYPGDWFINDTLSAYRVYARNTQVDLSKEATPENFQQIWLSNDVDETSAAREDAIKKGESDFRVVNGAVKASTIKAGGVTINTYEYQTVGGVTLEAYFTNKAGVRLMATSSTEVGEQNQTDMVANLRKVLTSITLAQ